MSGAKEIKRRIASVKNTRQITKAMKMVSAAKLRRAQEAVTSARPYADKMSEVIANLAARASGDDVHPMLSGRETVRKIAVYVITSDRGLCGGFNSGVVRAAKAFVRDKRAEGLEVDIYTIGKKGRDQLRRDPGFCKSYVDVSNRYRYDDIKDLVAELNQNYMDEAYDEVHAIFNKFVSVLTQEPTLTQLLPVVPSEPAEGEELLDYMYEPSEQVLLERMLPKNVEVQLHTMMLDSVASEHAARMTAMDSATSNASDMIDRLTLMYNRARQAAITKELSEIVGGAEAL